MTAEEWDLVIYKVLGIPDAVTDKRAIAHEVLAGLPVSEERRTHQGGLAAARSDAEFVVLARLAHELAKGLLDRALVGLESPTAHAEDLAMAMGNHGDGDAAQARRKVLEYLLPKIVEQVVPPTL